ncbi:MAG TPA: cytochrome c1 [Kiloniellaceae bacterium]|nr:cytochrome c1 [Kiloniellaceae bacterium]
MGSFFKGAVAALLATALFGPISLNSASAAEGVAIPEQHWSFSAPFGSFDNEARQRGLQVYREVCSACHSLDYIAFRNLEALGYSEEQVKALAAQYTIEDGPNDEGDMFERPGKPSDYFPSPFPNAKAAAAANGGAAPPDLSLIAKARPHGPDYIYALLTGYEEPPADFQLMEGLNYNAYFPGHQIAMAAPLSEGAVEFSDGTPATVDQMAHDVTTFLMWTAEPHLDASREMGIKVMLFLVVFCFMLYAVKRKIWHDIH